MTLYELLNNFDEVIKFDLFKKLKIFIISSISEMDRLTADVEEYFIGDVPLRLLNKKVFKVYHFENAIEVFK